MEKLGDGPSKLFGLFGRGTFRVGNFELWVSACGGFQWAWDLGLLPLAGIYGLGRWFTEGHMETAGDESVAAIVFGKNVFSYAKTERAGKWFIEWVRSAVAF